MEEYLCICSALYTQQCGLISSVLLYFSITVFVLTEVGLLLLLAQTSRDHGWQP